MLHTSLSAKKIVAGELQIVQGALRVEEKWLAAPAAEEAVVPEFRHPRLLPGRDRCSFDYGLSVVAGPGGMLAFNAADCRSLPTALGAGEAHSVCDIGNGIAISVNFKLICRVGREGLGRRGPGRVHTR
jgi:ABC-type taurine transport system ATPase subunit